MRLLNLEIGHVTRVEGHGNIVINARKGELEECHLAIVESPRFFEAMIVNRPWDEIVHITSRICGICAVGHTTASVRAMEAALGLKPSAQTVRLRRLSLHGEVIQSHVLHVYILASPDFFGVKSIFPMIKTHRDVVLRALRLKRLANNLCEIIGGRHVHPISEVVGGFTRLPTRDQLVEMRCRFEECRPDIEETVKLFAGVQIPDFERETEYVSLASSDGVTYPFYDGDVISSDGWRLDPGDYLEHIHEFIVPHCTAKHARSSRNAYAVGALARLNNNYDLLDPKAKEAAERLGYKVPNHNPFHNNLAQVIETVHCFEESIALLDDCIENGLEEEERHISVAGGRGIGAVEVPRGLLLHDYTVNDDGIVEEANCIIPTAQNLGNIDRDMRAFVPRILDRPKEEIALFCEMLVRAYDPCISCSAHLLDVEFV